MTKITLGLFNNTEDAGKAVADLKVKGYTKEISILTKGEEGETDIKETKQDTEKGTATGAAVGGATGALAGIFSGITAVALPGVGLLVGGPLAVLLGAAGGVVGAATGSIVGSLVDLGINESTAALYDNKISEGQVLVGVSTEDEDAHKIGRQFSDHGGQEITTISSVT